MGRRDASDTSRDATRTYALTWSNVVETTTPVEVMGRYSNPDNVARLNRILSGQGRDRPSHRPVPSLRQKQTRLADSDRSEVLERYQAGESADALPTRSTFIAPRSSAIVQPRRHQVSLSDPRPTHDVTVAPSMYEEGQSLATIAKHFGVADRTVLNAFRRARYTDAWSRDEPVEPEAILTALAPRRRTPRLTAGLRDPQYRHSGTCCTRVAA